MTLSRHEQDKKWLQAAAQYAEERSLSNGRKVGCLLIPVNVHEPMVIATNELPSNVEETVARLSKPGKNVWVEHAERMAIYKAARMGVSLTDATAYVTWFPCIDCARGLTLSGVKRVVCGKQPDLEDPNWGKSFTAAYGYMLEAEVDVDIIDDMEYARSGKFEGMVLSYDSTSGTGIVRLPDERQRCFVRPLTLHDPQPLDRVQVHMTNNEVKTITDL